MKEIIKKFDCVYNFLVTKEIFGKNINDLANKSLTDILKLIQKFQDTTYEKATYENKNGEIHEIKAPNSTINPSEIEILINKMSSKHIANQL